VIRKRGRSTSPLTWPGRLAGTEGSVEFEANTTKTRRDGAWRYLRSNRFTSA
jgi:hypothetical protein